MWLSTERVLYAKPWFQRRVVGFPFSGDRAVCTMCRAAALPFCGDERSVTRAEPRGNHGHCTASRVHCGGVCGSNGVLVCLVQLNEGARCPAVKLGLLRYFLSCYGVALTGLSSCNCVI